MGLAAIQNLRGSASCQSNYRTTSRDIVLISISEFFMPNYEEKPYLKKHQFTTDREEPLTAKITLRLPPSMLEKLKSLDNYPEFVRQAISDALNKLENSNDSTED